MKIFDAHIHYDGIRLAVGASVMLLLNESEKGEGEGEMEKEVMEEEEQQEEEEVMEVVREVVGAAEEEVEEFKMLEMFDGDDGELDLYDIDTWLTETFSE